MKTLGVNSFSGRWLVRLQIGHSPQGSLPFAVTCTPFSGVHHFRGKSYTMEEGLGGALAGVKGEGRTASLWDRRPNSLTCMVVKALNQRGRWGDLTHVLKEGPRNIVEVSNGRGADTIYDPSSPHYHP